MSADSSLLNAAAYSGYSYSYPHKTAYRRFDPPLYLADIWAQEPRDSLYLYIHVPFCEMRCGFCNLFTQANADDNLVTAYLAALARQARIVRRCVGELRFAGCAIGGGTPTWLGASQLDKLFEVTEELGADLHRIHTSVETSPETALPVRLRVLRRRGVQRVSIGVQSFNESEVHSIGRPQRNSAVAAALTAIREEAFPTLNLDLMYGLPGQTVATWLDSLRQALCYRPEELYLYPLYVRPLTGLGRCREAWDDCRLELYRAGRDFLLGEGYAQCSMRRFRSPQARLEEASAHSCQRDGMLGLGCGARSYTREIHYSSEYAVGRAVVREIVARWVVKNDEAFSHAEYGYRLDLADRKRRYLVQSLLEADGLDPAAYRLFFDGDVCDDFPELRELAEAGWLETLGRWRLTAAGLERSDQIGPWLYSRRVRHLMESYQSQ